VLVFGCRSEADDYYYKDEWSTIPSLTVITAFSRANPTEGKTYAQHKIRENAQVLSELILGEGASVYVSGRAKFMPKSV